MPVNRTRTVDRNDIICSLRELPDGRLAVMATFEGYKTVEGIGGTQLGALQDIFGRDLEAIIPLSESGRRLMVRQYRINTTVEVKVECDSELTLQVLALAAATGFHVWAEKGG